jgi:hypothetical protein
MALAFLATLPLGVSLQKGLTEGCVARFYLIMQTQQLYFSFFHLLLLALSKQWDCAAPMLASGHDSSP